MSDREQWRDVVGYEGRYEVSTWGRLKNVRSGRVLQGSPNAGGYVVVRLTLGPGQGRMYYLHRLVCAAFRGPPPSPAHIVRHLNGQKIDCAARNLAWCTRRGNSAHASKLGLLRGPFGTKNTNARLTDEAVIAMRRRSRAGESYTQLAGAFGVSVSAVFRAVIGRTWRHVRDNEPSIQMPRRWPLQQEAPRVSGATETDCWSPSL